MNYKQIFASWFGLGLLMLALQYAFQYVFHLIGFTGIRSLAIVLSGFTASMIFTHYFYRRIMSPAFKIYAILTTFFLSIIIASGIIMSNPDLRSALQALLNSIFKGPDTKTYVFTIAFMIGILLIQFAVWYLFITMGNKQMVKHLQKEAHKQ